MVTVVDSVFNIVPAIKKCAKDQIIYFCMENKYFNLSVIRKDCYIQLFQLYPVSPEEVNFVNNKHLKQICSFYVILMIALLYYIPDNFCYSMNERDDLTKPKSNVSFKINVR